MIYYFHIKGDRPFTDTEGLELAGIEAVRAEAVGVVVDFRRMEPLREDWSGWSIRVLDETDTVVLELPFTEH